MNNAIPNVLAAGAICAAVQGRELWVGILISLAMLIAVLQNWINSKILAKQMRR